MIPLPSRPGLDASTAIILNQAGILADVLTGFTVRTTSAVLEEIKTGPDGPLIAALLHGPVLAAAGSGGAFGPGENSLLALYAQGLIDSLFTDDGPCLRYCRRKNIPHFSAIMLPYLLWRQQACDRETALKWFNDLKPLGRYADWVVEYAEELMSKE